MKPIIFSMGILVSAFFCHAQRDLRMSQLAMTQMYLNPAAAGLSNVYEIESSFRRQWVGLDGGQIGGQRLAGSMPIRHQSMGLGINLSRDVNGHFINEYYSAVGSYKIRIHKGVLALGLEAGMRHNHIDFQNFSIRDDDDIIVQERGTEWVPDLNAGIFYYGHLMKMAFSARHLTRPNLSFANKALSNDSRLERHYYGLISFKFRSYKPFYIVPIIQTAFSKNTFFVNSIVRFNWKDDFWVGTGLTTALEYNIHVGLRLDRYLKRLSGQLRIGYGYDFAIAGVAKGLGGTHEILLNYRFKPRPRVENIKNTLPSTNPIDVN